MQCKNYCEVTNNYCKGTLILLHGDTKLLHLPATVSHDLARTSVFPSKIYWEVTKLLLGNAEMIMRECKSMYVKKSDYDSLGDQHIYVLTSGDIILEYYHWQMSCPPLHAVSLTELGCLLPFHLVFLFSAFAMFLLFFVIHWLCQAHLSQSSSFQALCAETA